MKSLKTLSAVYNAIIDNYKNHGQYPQNSQELCQWVKSTGYDTSPDSCHSACVELRTMGMIDFGLEELEVGMHRKYRRLNKSFKIHVFTTDIEAHVRKYFFDKGFLHVDIGGTLCLNKESISFRAFKLRYVNGLWTPFVKFPRNAPTDPVLFVPIGPWSEEIASSNYWQLDFRIT